jgi:hypothetical protein
MQGTWAPALVALLPSPMCTAPEIEQRSCQTAKDEQKPSGRTGKEWPRKSTKSDSKLHDSFPIFAQTKFNLARTYPQEIIAWD